MMAICKVIAMRCRWKYDKQQHESAALDYVGSFVVGFHSSQDSTYHVTRSNLTCEQETKNDSHGGNVIFSILGSDSIQAFRVWPCLLRL
jgi:hypothetical protein